MNTTHPAASTVNPAEGRANLPAEQRKAGLVRIEPGSTPPRLGTGPR
jgi:hypothetical protein